MRRSLDGRHGGMSEKEEEMCVAGGLKAGVGSLQ